MSIGRVGFAANNRSGGAVVDPYALPASLTATQYHRFVANHPSNIIDPVTNTMSAAYDLGTGAIGWTQPLAVYQPDVTVDGGIHTSVGTTTPESLVRSDGTVNFVSTNVTTLFYVTPPTVWQPTGTLNAYLSVLGGINLFNVPVLALSQTAGVASLLVNGDSLYPADIPLTASLVGLYSVQMRTVGVNASQLRVTYTDPVLGNIILQDWVTPSISTSMGTTLHKLGSSLSNALNLTPVNAHLYEAFVTQAVLTDADIADYYNATKGNYGL